MKPTAHPGDMDPMTSIIAAVIACGAVAAPAIGRWVRRRRSDPRRRDTRHRD